MPTPDSETLSLVDGNSVVRRWSKVNLVWTLVAAVGLLVFSAGLFGITQLMSHSAEMYFYVVSDQGQPQSSEFPVKGGLFCEPEPFLFGTCANVNVTEFNPSVPAFAKDQRFEVWYVRSDEESGCHAVAFQVVGTTYATPQFGWLAPLNEATPWALLLGFVAAVTATFGLARRRAWVLVPVLVLPVLVALTYFSFHPFLASC